MSIFADRDIIMYKVWKSWQSKISRKMNKILPLLNIIDSRNDEIRDEVIKRIDQGSVDQYQIVSLTIYRPRTRSMNPWHRFKRKGSRTRCMDCNSWIEKLLSFETQSGFQIDDHEMALYKSRSKKLTNERLISKFWKSTLEFVKISYAVCATYLRWAS